MRIESGALAYQCLLKTCDVISYIAEKVMEAVQFIFSSAEKMFSWLEDLSERIWAQVIDPALDFLSENFFIGDTGPYAQKIKEVRKKYESYYPHFTRGSEQSQKVHNFEQLELSILTNKTTEEIIQSIRNKGLAGFVHLNHYQVEHTATIENIKTGIHLLHRAMSEHPIEKVREVLLGTGPCFQATFESLQELITSSDHREIYLFAPNKDPKHSAEVRTGELVRVYRNIQARRILQEKGTLHPTPDEIFAEDVDLNEEEIVNWCRQENHFGHLSGQIEQTDMHRIFGLFTKFLTEEVFRQKLGPILEALG